MTLAAVAPSARAPSAPRPAIICDSRRPSRTSQPSASIRTISPTSRASRSRSTISGSETSGSSSTALASLPDGLDEVGLERPLLLGGAREAEPVEHVDQRLAVVGGDHREAAAGGLDLLERAPLGGRRGVTACVVFG